MIGVSLNYRHTQTIGHGLKGDRTTVLSVSELYDQNLLTSMNHEGQRFASPSSSSVTIQSNTTYL